MSRASGTLPWTVARQVAARAATPLPVVPARLGEAVGAVLAETVLALSDLPPFDTAAMDGWAVAGRGPWHLVEAPVLAGAERGRLDPGTAAPIATGAVVPDGADAVLRSEDGVVGGTRTGARLMARDPLTGVPADGTLLRPGTDLRRQGQECRAGTPLVVHGCTVTPAVVGLAAAAGYDELPVVRPPVVATLVLGDELLDRGLPRSGKVRDALGPMVPPWLADLGARANPPVHVADSRDALLEAVEDADVDVLVTTGSTAHGPVDHLHDVLAHLRAHWLVDGVAVRPGHPMLLARLPDGRHVVGLPGNPLAAVSGIVTLAVPLLAGLRGDPGAVDRGCRDAELTESVTSHPDDVRLVPVSLGEVAASLVAHPLRYAGPAMLRGLALADGLAVIAPNGGLRGSTVTVLPVPR